MFRLRLHMWEEFRYLMYQHETGISKALAFVLK